MSRAAVGAGSVLSGRYRLVETLARGGMGTVWRALDLLLDRPVAVKEVLLPPGLDDGEADLLRRRTIREAQAAARVRHPAIVTIFDVVEQDGRPWIVMELVASRSLAQIIRADGPLPPLRVAAIGLRVLDAIGAAAAGGIEHRDIKPANVLVSNEGRVVLTDFGIARNVGDETLTATGLIVGSPDYLAPERARGQSSGIASDLWSLGATMYHAVEGAPPFARNGPLPTLAAVVMDEPEPPVRAGPLRPVIDGLLVKDPAHRLDADRARQMLQRVLRRRPVEGTVPIPRRPLDNTLTGSEPAPTPDPRPASAPAPVPAPPPEPGPGPGPGPTAELAPGPAPEPPPGPGPGPTAELAPGRATEPAAAAASEPGARRRRTLLVAAVVVLLVGIGVGVLVPLLHSGSPPPQATGRPTTAAPSRTGSPPSVASGAATSPPARPPASAPAAPGTSAPAGAGVAAPAGFTRYTDPSTGFSVVVPAGWKPGRHDTRVDFDDPGSSRFLRIDTSDTPLPDPYRNWIDYERQFRQGKADYRNLGIRRVTDYRTGAGWSTADWEFTLGGTHVLDRNIRVSDARAHAIYWSTPDSQWDAASSRQILQLAEQSFVPAPAGR